MTTKGGEKEEKETPKAEAEHNKRENKNILSDQTKIKNTTWKDLKILAMCADYKEQSFFVSVLSKVLSIIIRHDRVVSGY